MRKLCLVVIALLLLAVGCGSRVDPEAERAALRAADAAWAETPPDVDRFVSFLTENATAVIPDVPPTVGRQAIRSLWSPTFSAPGFALHWSASRVEVARAGDLGYTLGSFEMTVKDSAGQEVKRTGKYLTVWEKQPDGQWKASVDVVSMDSEARR